MDQKSYFTQKAIKEVIVFLEETGAMEKIKESKMQSFFEKSLNRIATTAIDDYRKLIHDLSYELTEEINTKN